MTPTESTHLARPAHTTITTPAQAAFADGQRLALAAIEQGTVTLTTIIVSR